MTNGAANLRLVKNDHCTGSLTVAACLVSGSTISWPRRTILAESGARRVQAADLGLLVQAFRGLHRASRYGDRVALLSSFAACDRQTDHPASNGGEHDLMRLPPIITTTKLWFYPNALQIAICAVDHTDLWCWSLTLDLPAHCEPLPQRRDLRTNPKSAPPIRRRC